MDPRRGIAERICVRKNKYTYTCWIYPRIPIDTAVPIVELVYVVEYLPSEWNETRAINLNVHIREIYYKNILLLFWLTAQLSLVMTHYQIRVRSLTIVPKSANKDAYNILWKIMSWYFIEFDVRSLAVENDVSLFIFECSSRVTYRAHICIPYILMQDTQSVTKR